MEGQASNIPDAALVILSFFRSASVAAHQNESTLTSLWLGNSYCTPRGCINSVALSGPGPSIVMDNGVLGSSRKNVGKERADANVGVSVG